MSRRRVERKVHRATFPSRKRLTDTEALDVLRRGPDPAWFKPWAERGVLLAAMRAGRYGYVHVTGDSAAPEYDLRLFPDREGLSWALHHLHSAHPRCGDQCHGLFYFMPDEGLTLRLVIEPDEDDNEANA